MAPLQAVLLEVASVQGRFVEISYLSGPNSHVRLKEAVFDHFGPFWFISGHFRSFWVILGDFG